MYLGRSYKELLSSDSLARAVLGVEPPLVGVVTASAKDTQLALEIFLQRARVRRQPSDEGTAS